MKAAQFSLIVDNPSFTVKPAEIQLPSKKSTVVAIAFKAPHSNPSTGKLTIQCDENPSVSWVYYLKGIQ
jgi:hypothetical protein